MDPHKLFHLIQVIGFEVEGQTLSTALTALSAVIVRIIEQNNLDEAQAADAREFVKTMIEVKFSQGSAV